MARGAERPADDIDFSWSALPRSLKCFFGLIFVAGAAGFGGLVYDDLTTPDEVKNERWRKSTIERVDRSLVDDGFGNAEVVDGEYGSGPIRLRVPLSAACVIEVIADLDRGTGRGDSYTTDLQPAPPSIGNPEGTAERVITFRDREDLTSESGWCALPP